jgi:hypothetical protein
MDGAQDVWDVQLDHLNLRNNRIVGELPDEIRKLSESLVRQPTPPRPAQRRGETMRCENGDLTSSLAPFSNACFLAGGAVPGREQPDGPARLPRGVHAAAAAHRQRQPAAVGLRVRVEIVESQKYKSAGESQPVPIMNDGGWPCLGGRVIGSPCLGGRAPTHGCRAYADRGDVLAGPCRPSRPSCQSCTPHPTTSAGCRRPCGGARPGVLLGGRVDWDLPT